MPQIDVMSRASLSALKYEDGNRSCKSHESFSQASVWDLLIEVDSAVER